MKKAKKISLLQFFFILLSSILLFYIFFQRFDTIVYENLTPQVKRAIIQTSVSLPLLLENEQALRDTYETMKQSRVQTAEKSGITLPPEDADIEEIIDRNISWESNISGICIGNSGNVQVIPQNEIKNIQTFTPIAISDIPADATEESLDVHFDPILTGNSYKEDPFSFFTDARYGCVLSYQDSYIICGIRLTEYLLDTLVLSGFATILYLILTWIFFRYCGFYLKRGYGNRKEILIRLIGLALGLCLAMFCLPLYYQRLKNVTYDLKTTNRHAEAAVSTLEQYEDEKTKINEWLDAQYLLQCRMAAEIVKQHGKENLSRNDLAEYAAALGVEHIYVFDQEGKVVITNAPYDHFVLSKDPTDQSYAFRALLDGADHIIQRPMKNEVMGDYMQYIGVSLRNSDDLCDGFVQIAVDPSLRDALCAPLSIDNVLEKMVIGLPEHAIAVDHSDLTIVSTTGIGYPGQKISDIGIAENEILDGFSGYLHINGRAYYAGVRETRDFYLIPIVSGLAMSSSFTVSLCLFLYTLAAFVILLLIADYGIKKYVTEETLTEEEDTDPAFGTTPAKTASQQSSDSNGSLSQLKDEISSRFKIPEKKRFDDRWKMSHIPKEEQTPEMRLKVIVYRILFLFCLLVLLPEFFNRLRGENAFGFTSTIGYVISGKWQKGINIYAFSSCLFLICAMYVAVVILSRLLYYIARISSMRVETICLLSKSVIKYVCVIIFAYYGLAQFGVDTKTLLASAGILSLMIGIGAKDLVNDIIAGFFIIFEGSFIVGDWIKVGSWIGMIREIGIRTTKVEFFADTMVFNNSSLRNVAVTDGSLSYMRANIPVAYETDIPYLEDVLKKELPKLVEKNPLISRAKYQGIDRFAESAMEIRIYCFTDPARRGPAMRQFYRDLKIVFDQYGIVIPYQQVVVHEAKDPLE